MTMTAEAQIERDASEILVAGCDAEERSGQFETHDVPIQRLAGVSRESMSEVGRSDLQRACDVLQRETRFGHVVYVVEHAPNERLIAFRTPRFIAGHDVFEEAGQTFVRSTAFAGMTLCGVQQVEIKSVSDPLRSRGRDMHAAALRERRRTATFRQRVDELRARAQDDALIAAVRMRHPEGVTRVRAQQCRRIRENIFAIRMPHEAAAQRQREVQMRRKFASSGNLVLAVAADELNLAELTAMERDDRVVRKRLYTSSDRGHGKNLIAPLSRQYID